MTSISENAESIASTTGSTIRNENDTMKILVATDIHLGYNETDPIRGNDSFNTFEEILQIAVANDVDFILLGGDLFHENKPSVTCYHKCISLLKRYTLGDKPVSIEFLSDQSRNFSHLRNPAVNYEDSNMNIGIPVFSIHGNHDDPTGANQLSAMDIIADTGLINYFGKWTDLTKVEIYPLMMKKGETKLAIYGLSHIKDERLSRLFRDEKVLMDKPPDSENWFNILVLHQNRAQNRGLKNYIPEAVLPQFLDLVVWGHEHDCIIAPLESNGIMITQPGSSVATSLAVGESLPKHVGLLHIYKQEFAMHGIKLNTVRPFVFKEVFITKPEGELNKKSSEYAKEKITEIVEEMLQAAKLLETEDSPKLPLIRLVAHFSDESMITNQIRMGQQFADKVANPIDMFSFKVKRTINVKKGHKDDVQDVEEMITEEFAESINDLVDKYFESKTENLSVLSIQGLCEAVSRYVDKNDTDALDDIFKHQMNKTLDKFMQLENLELDDKTVDHYLEEFRLERANKKNEEFAEISKLLDDEKRTKARKPSDDVTEISSDEDISDTSLSLSSSSVSRGGTSGRQPRGRRARGARGPRGGRGRAKAT